MAGLFARTDIPVQADDLADRRVGFTNAEDALDLCELVVDCLVAITSNRDDTMDLGTF